MYTVSEIHTGKLGIFLLALLFRAALLLDFWNFSYWHYYLGRHFYSRQESRERQAKNAKKLSKIKTGKHCFSLFHKKYES